MIEVRDKWGVDREVSGCEEVGAEGGECVGAADGGGCDDGGVSGAGVISSQDSARDQEVSATGNGSGECGRTESAAVHDDGIGVGESGVTGCESAIGVDDYFFVCESNVGGEPKNPVGVDNSGIGICSRTGAKRIGVFYKERGICDGGYAGECIGGGESDIAEVHVKICEGTVMVREYRTDDESAGDVGEAEAEGVGGEVGADVKL